MTMGRTCDTCYDKDVCGGCVVCDCYSPLGEEAEDEFLYDLVEKERMSFYDEWREYTSDFD